VIAAIAIEAQRRLASRARICAAFTTTAPGAIVFEIKDKEQKRQVDRDLEHLEQRRRAADVEIEAEPRAVEALHEVKMTRLSPVGLIVTWPEAVI
jgi:hypothetical protein